MGSLASRARHIAALFRSSLVPIAMQARCVVFPADPVDYSGACVIAGEDVPSESHAAVRLASLPAVAMHHREALAKDVDPRQSAPFQDPTPPLGFHKRKPQQQHNVRAKVERAFDKRLNDAVRRVSENTLGSVRHPCLGPSRTKSSGKPESATSLA